jgi:hypothetical protein
MMTLIQWITKNVKNIYSRFRKTISGSFTGLFNAPVVPLHINKPLTINVDELNKIFRINENYTMAHGRCSSLVFKRQPYYIVQICIKQT